MLVLVITLRTTWFDLSLISLTHATAASRLYTATIASAALVVDTWPPAPALALRLAAALHAFRNRPISMYLWIRDVVLVAVPMAWVMARECGSLLCARARACFEAPCLERPRGRTIDVRTVECA